MAGWRSGRGVRYMPWILSLAIGLMLYTAYSTLYDVGQQNAVDSTDTQSVEWMKMRQETLSQGGARRVLLFSYMRGGSTIGGQMFNQHDNSIMWYEPGDAFFMWYYGISEENLPQHDLYHHNGTRRELSDDELRSQTRYYTNHLNCNFAALPTAALTHHFLLNSRAHSSYVSSMGRSVERDGDESLSQCMRYIPPLCLNSVKTSADEKCHELLRHTEAVFQTHATTVEGLVRYHGETQTLHAEVSRLLEAKLMEKLTDTNQFFDPRLLNKLKWFVRYQLCLDILRAKARLFLPQLTQRCERSTLRVLEVNRLKMEDVESLVVENPGLDVVFYIRDPRAIATSRSETEHMVVDIANFSPPTEAGHVCRKMAEDLEHYERLNSKYPGAFRQMRYEHLIRDPIETASSILSPLGVDESMLFLEAWRDYVRRHVATVSPTGADNSGSAETQLSLDVSKIDKWRNTVSGNEQDKMLIQCRTLLNQLGYSP